MKNKERCHFLRFRSLFALIIIGFAISACREPEASVPKLSGTVSIDGTAQVGETLTAVTDSLKGKGVISYQWKRGTGGGGAVNSGANSGTYMVQAADLGSIITVTVTRSGYSGSVSSEPTSAVILPPFAGTVTITGNAWVGQMLTAHTGFLDDSGDISYQWKRWGPGDGAAVINVGDNSGSYVVQTADLVSTITVTVTRSGYSGSKTSDPTDVVTLPPLSGTVTIDGNAEVGQTLTANTADLDGTGTISYQWKRGTAIIGVNRTYVVKNADLDSTITVTVSRSGNFGSKTSNPTATVIPAPPPVQRTYEESVAKVEFTGNTATVTFNNLSNNDIYLVKVNTSSSQATANTTGSVQSVSPSFLSDDIESSPVPLVDKPRMGHPAADEFRANRPPIVRETTRPLAEIIPPRLAVLGDTRTFWVDEPNGLWVQRQATLLATGTYGNIWVHDNKINIQQAQALSSKFDIIYPAETNILGYEYGGGPGGNGGKDGDPKIQILVYDIGASILGYFWEIDFYEQSQLGSQYRTNLAEIFYINSRYMTSSPDLIYLTLAHEFQHMINFNRKFVENGKESPTWYDETLSMMTEDMMAYILGIPTTHADHPIRDHIPFFIESYTAVGFSEWDIPGGAYPYSKGYAFGAYLMRNYGGADLLRRILANNSVGIDSITEALNAIEPGMTFAKAVSRFGEAMIFSGNSKPEGGHTFDKTVTTTVTGNNGTHSYTLPAFNIWNTRRESSSYLGPIVYSLTQRNMRGNSVLVQQDASWKNRTGSISITLNQPSNANVEMYLMVR